MNTHMHSHIIIAYLTYYRQLSWGCLCEDHGKKNLTGAELSKAFKGFYFLTLYQKEEEG